MTSLYIIFWLATHCAAGALGYRFSLVVQRYRTAERERVLRALGGKLPDWEQFARTVEDEANKHTLKGYAATADSLRSQADIIRDRGRKRDKEWQ